MDIKHDPLRAALDIREQLASERRRLAFFLGAGTSMAVGIPGIYELSTKILDHLDDEEKKLYASLQKKLGAEKNVEKILDRLRTIRDLIGEDESLEYDGIKGFTESKKLDTKICEAISKNVQIKSADQLKPHIIFAQWIRALHNHRHCPVELFTTNYDLFLEEAMECVNVPFFDGFVGSVAPFFAPESVEAEEKKGMAEKAGESVFPPRAWTRLWKLHGSINWRLIKNAISGKQSITRLLDGSKPNANELIIFPSRDKYSESRKLPFITYQDRLRKFLNNGESLLIVAGYSFSDQHLNEVILQGLRSNPRLAILCLVYGESDAKKKLSVPDEILKIGAQNKNFTIYGPDKACIGGIVGEWTEPSLTGETKNWPFWNEKDKAFTLGDFNKLSAFLEIAIGFNDFEKKATVASADSRDEAKK